MGDTEDVTRQSLLPVFGSGYGTKHTDLHVSNPAPFKKGVKDDQHCVTADRLRAREPARRLSSRR